MGGSRQQLNLPQAISRAAGATLIACAFAAPAAGQATRQPYRVFQKTHKIVLDVGPPGAFDSTQAKYPSILKVGDQWRMWYNGRTDDRFTGAIGLATSTDGLRWKKANGGRPVFKTGASGTFDSTKVDHPAVLRFAGRFHMWYTAGDRRSRYTIGYATSDDGMAWRRANGGRPVFGPGAKGKFDDQVVLHPAVVRDASGLLHLWYNGVGPQKSFRVGHATSLDGVRWTRQNDGNPVLQPSVVGDFREGYVYNVHVRVEQGQFHMWYSAWAPQERTVGPNHNCITHAVSRDGNHWVKDSTPTLVNGPPGAIDEYACFACYLVVHANQWRMYYSVGSGAGGRRYRVGLATAPLRTPSRNR